MSRLALITLLAAATVLTGCARFERRQPDPARITAVERPVIQRGYKLSREQEDEILALDPEHVTDQVIRGPLAHAPAPRLLNIHGGIHPVHREMIGFGEFLVGMGYPEGSIRNPGDGAWTFSCYESAKNIAGAAAWYYEREGMRPMMIGHSQGGMQAVKVLQLVAGPPSRKLSVWNPVTRKKEPRHAITDPLTGKPRPVVGLEFSYVASLGAGGLARLLPNQLDMMFSLRTVPDSVVEFSGFYLGGDVLGGDHLGYGSANHYHAAGRAKVRNVRLPDHYSHYRAPNAVHLLTSPAVRDWLSDYQPTDSPEEPTGLEGDTKHILFAADVWHSIRRHWVLELQHLIRAKRATASGPRL
jgi:hypothetical protein